MKETGVVYLVDDEPGMLRALTRLLAADGFTVKCYRSARDFLADDLKGSRACLVLDVAMPELDGMTLQQRLTTQGSTLPVIFLTGHGDIAMSVRAIKLGAVDFLTKPVKAVELLAAVRAALKIAGEQVAGRQATLELRERLASLTPREHEVMTHVIAGGLNKQIAAALGIREQTVKIHRMRVMEKLGLHSVVELVHAAERLGVKPPDHRTKVE